MNVTVTGITQYQSYSYVIREMFLKTVVALPFFADFTIKRTRRIPIKADDLPLLALYIIDDQMAPDGDANAGDIRFIHTCCLGFSAIIINNDEQQSEQALDAAFWAIMNGLWTNQYLMSMVDTWNPHLGYSNPDGTRIEGILRGVRKHLYGNAGANNETPIGEMQFEVWLTYRSMWDPVITDTFDMFTSQTQFKSDHDGLTSSVDQVEIVVDNTQPGTPPFPDTMPDPFTDFAFTKSNGKNNGDDPNGKH